MALPIISRSEREPFWLLEDRLGYESFGKIDSNWGTLLGMGAVGFLLFVLHIGVFPEVCPTFLSPWPVGLVLRFGLFPYSIKAILGKREGRPYR